MVLTEEYGVEYHYIYSGNHARQPHSSSPNRREFALFVLKIKMAFIGSLSYSGTLLEDMEMIAFRTSVQVSVLSSERSSSGRGTAITTLVEQSLSA